MRRQKMSTQQEIGWNFQSTYDQLPEKFYALVRPNEVVAPTLVQLNEQLARELQLDPMKLRQDGVQLLAGSECPNDIWPIAQAYAGHQFGHLAKLGDGRALLLGRQQAKNGESYDIQLKGAGKTPFSRNGDGRAAIGPMLREYLISEAMHHLNISTTRSLAVVLTGEKIARERLLDGAILTRIAKSHIRVGTFEYAYHFGTDLDLDDLVMYTIQEVYPHLTKHDYPALALLEEVIDAQAKLIASWQHVGFIHGVMNTDNMAISGETIDYGPCAFMDIYNPQTVFSSIDRDGRYAYANQPIIGEWNLARFAETLIPLLDEDDEEKGLELAKQALNRYRQLFEQYWYEGMCQKLALPLDKPESGKFIQELLSLMEKFDADYTNTFVAITTNMYEGELLFQTRPFKDWLAAWKGFIAYDEHQEAIQQQLKSVNPAVIPRNTFVEDALEAYVNDGNIEPFHRLLQAVQNPYEYGEEQKQYQDPPKSTEPYFTYCGT